MLDKESRAQAIASIQEHFRAERGEKLGDLAASGMLAFFEQEVAPLYYNQAVKDARALAARQTGTLLEELDYLEMAKKGRR